MFNVSRRKIYDIERKSELRNKTVLIFKTELYIIFISNVYDVEIYGRFGFFGIKIIIIKPLVQLEDVIFFGNVLLDT